MTAAAVADKLESKLVEQDKDERETPRDLFEALHAEFGFTLDGAATELNAKLPRFCTRHGTCPAAGAESRDWDERDGLAFPWDGERVFLNPPFSQLPTWVERSWHTTGTVVMLAPQNRQEQGWWQTSIEPYRDRAGSVLTTRNLPDRRHFTVNGGQPIINERTGKRSAPEFGIVLLIWDRRGPDRIWTRDNGIPPNGHTPQMEALARVPSRAAERPSDNRNARARLSR